ncbi:polyketide cyclase [Clostridium acetobutylicum]|nr:polyketide cyclase [Clostridium acetobutylicum]
MINIAVDNSIKITIETTVNAPIDMVWEVWTEPEHIKSWNHASDDWHTTEAKNDLRVGGRFVSKMEAKDGSFGFDFGGTYNEVRLYEFISYIMDDDRSVEITFKPEKDKTYIVESFEAEKSNPIDLQQKGWQAILDNFKKYVEEKIS